MRAGKKKETLAETNPSTDADTPSQLNAPPFQHPSSTARPHRRRVQTNASPAMSPRVGLGARIQGTGTEAIVRLGE